LTSVVVPVVMVEPLAAVLLKMLVHVEPLAAVLLKMLVHV